jgi:S1-C subfamily serine protease
LQAETVNQAYRNFKNELVKIEGQPDYDQKLIELEAKYNYKEGTAIQIKHTFVDCIDRISKINFHFHPKYDLAILQFEGFKNLSYNGYAKFITETSSIMPGKYLCKLGYPFSEFSNFKYNEENDDIEWTQEGVSGTPRFPIDGIITRYIISDSQVFAVEMSTPGLRGQSGGPLFDQDGNIYGMQSMTHHKHLGFDIVDQEINKGSQKRIVSNFPFIHLGICIHVNVIKDFLKQYGVKFYEIDDVTEAV